MLVKTKGLLPFLSTINPLRFPAANIFLAIILVAYFGTKNYLLFHGLSEAFSIVISFTAFIVVWNSKDLIKNKYFLFVGISYFFISIIDLLHTLAFKGMGVFPGTEANLATQLWISARYMQAFSLLLAPIFIDRRLRSNLIFISYFLLTSLIIVSIFIFNWFPVAYTDGVGLTRFKIISEYIICLVLFAAIYFIYRKRKKFDPKVLNLIIGSLLFTSVSEIFFTFYIGVYDISNLIGHLFKIISFYLFYVAVVETGLSRPFNLLFLELKRKEEQIIQDKDKIEEYLNLSNSIFLVLDKIGNVLFINKKGEEILGLPKNQIVGKNWFKNFIPKHQSKKVNTIFKKVVKGEMKNIDYFENYILGKKGQRLIGWHNSLLFNKQRKMTALVSSGSDITQHNIMELKLRESDLKYRKLFNNKLSAVTYCKAIFDKSKKPTDYVFLDVNKAFEEQTGLKKEAVIDRRLTEVLPSIEKSQSAYIEKLGKVALTKEEIRFEEYNEQLKRWFSVYVYSPKKGYFISIFNDITPEKDLQKRKDEFIGIASHELKTPITSIKVFSEILDKRLKSSKDVRSSYLASAIHEQTNKLTELVSDLLDVTKIEEGKLKINKKIFDLNDLVRKTVINYQHTIDTHQIIKEGVINGKVLADEIRIGQVLNNLVNNAVKYSPRGGKVIVKLIDTDDTVKVSVEDSGPGIPTAVRRKIFNRFYRGSNEERKGLNGFGLGLYISHQIVKRHSGKIWVESGDKKGARFVFTLPKDSDQIKLKYN